MKISDVEIPKYSKNEELWNAISHGIGALLALIFGPFIIVKACNSQDIWKIVTISIYVFALVALYTMSCLYHSLSKNTKAKKVLRIMDHNMIYVLIIGTYTPYCLISLRTAQGLLPGIGTTGWVIFFITLLACLVGIIFNSININKFKVLSMICNLVGGWSIVCAMGTLINAIGMAGAMLCLAGGISYTIGAILYGIGKKHKYMHSVFHFFVLLGSILQFISIFYFVL
jgi:hemolysin III